MVLYFFKALKVFAETSSFVFARVIANVYFVAFSALIAFAFTFLPLFFGFSNDLKMALLLLGLIVFLVYWTFFRTRLLYVLRSSEAVVVSEFISGRSVPVARQASFGFNLIKKKFSSLNNFRSFEGKAKKAIKKIYGVLGFVSFIPNVDSAVFSSILAYVFADPSVDPFTALRDSLVLFYQKRNFILFQVFAMQIFSYTLFVVFYAFLYFLFSSFIAALSYPFTLLSYALIFLFLLLVYSSFVSHFLICWQSVFFIETIKNDSPLKNTRALLEELSPDFNDISSKAKVFVPLKSLSSRKLVSSFEAKKREEVLSSLDRIIKGKDEFERERKGEEALSELVSKITEIKFTSQKRKAKEKLEEKKKKISEKYKREQEYNTVFNMLLEFLGTELGTKHKFQITSMEKKGNLWIASVLINGEPFCFRLDSRGNVIDFKEK
jgi:hypothetical protein